AGPEAVGGGAARRGAAGGRRAGGRGGRGPARTAAPRARPDTMGSGTVQTRPRPRREEAERPLPRPGSRLATDLASGRFAISVELTPPRGIDPSRMLAGARLLKEAGGDDANVPDSAMRRLRVGASGMTPRGQR